MKSARLERDLGPRKQCLEGNYVPSPHRFADDSAECLRPRFTHRLPAESKRGSFLEKFAVSALHLDLMFQFLELPELFADAHGRFDCQAAITRSALPSTSRLCIRVEGVGNERHRGGDDRS
jgi:hypothetical protein